MTRVKGPRGGHLGLVVAAILCACNMGYATEDGADEPTLPPVPLVWRELRLDLRGYMRVRASVFHDFDLERGPTPTTGQPIFPVPAAGGSDHTLAGIDMRLRLEPTISVGQAVRIHLRVDVLDNVGYGSTPDVLPSTTSETYAVSSSSSPVPGLNSWSDAVKVKRAWGEVTLPFGVLQAGRMGALVNWGTGFFVNDGACASCDHGDSGDRIALTVPLLGHYLSGVYELSASGPYVVPFAQPVNLERRAQVQTGALSFYRFDSVEAQRRIVNAGRTLVQYGLLASYRSQELDAPAWLQPGGLVRGYGPPDFLRRGVKSFAGDVWLLVHHKGFRAELEAATVLAWIDDASNLPGVAFRQPVTAYQFGGVASLSYKFRFPLKLRAEVGFASGDDAPGFGVRVANGQTSTQKGDLDGPQLRPPGDTTINNFRFHPDYHVDLILWRRLIGQVTDAVYVRPSIVAGPFGSAMNAISFEAAVINSNAVYATTPPGQERALGTELNLLARYRYEPSFEIGLSYGVLFPGAGFRNLALALDAKPAQALELLLIYRI